MSKLFNTLEKIRHHEGSKEPPRRTAARKPIAGSKSAPPRFLALVLMAMVALMLLYTLLLSTKINLTPLTGTVRQLLSRLHVLPEASKEPSGATAPATPGGSLLQPLPPPSARAEAEQLVKTGVEFFQGGDAWRSIYYFDRARQLNPQAVEPLVNMAVALSELGLYGPANRLLREAVALNPNDEGLRKNLAILAEAGRLDESLQAKLNRGQAAAPQRGR